MKQSQERGAGWSLHRWQRMQTSPKYRVMNASNLKPSYVLSFVLGVTLMFVFSKLGASNAQPPSHVYELRLYHVKEGKMDALIARFGDHTDAIFKRHNMKSIAYWRPEDAPNSQNVFVYILEHLS